MSNVISFDAIHNMHMDLSQEDYDLVYTHMIRTIDQEAFYICDIKPLLRQSYAQLKKVGLL